MSDSVAPDPPATGDPGGPVTSLSSPVALSSAAASRLARAVTTWTGHLREQRDAMLGKVERSIARLTPTPDGADAFRLDDRSRTAFWTWFDRATTLWRTGNAALVATLGNEALGELRSSLLFGARFDVRPAPLDPTAWAPPPFDPFPAPPRDRLASLRTPWLLAGLLLALALPLVPATLPPVWRRWTIVVGRALAIVLVTWAVTRQHRRALALHHDRAVAELRARLLAQAIARLDAIADEQLAIVRRHLTETEVQRWEVAVQETRQEQLRLDGDDHDPQNRTPAFVRAMQQAASQAPVAALHAIEDEPSLFSPPSARKPK